MRLDEWQKWLDSQFLDSEPEQPVMPADEPVSAFLVECSPTATPPPLDENASVDASATLFDESEPAGAAATDSESPQIEPLIAASPIQADVEMPSIEQYMPFLRHPSSQQPEATPEAAEPASIEEAPLEGAARELAESGPAQENMQADIAESLPVAEEPSEERLVAAPVKSNRLGPTPSVQRTRQVRNVRPAAANSDFTPDMLWSLAPRHLELLLAMGSEEVTQNSYKRSFKESRVELLNRLLDPTLTLEDAARLLNVCPTTVRRYTNRGLLAHHRTQGDQRRFKLSDVLTFLEAKSAADSSDSRQPGTM